jgi:hypothetical protein
VYDPDRVPGHPVEELVAIVYQEHDANARSLNDQASAQRRPGNLDHYFLNTGRDTFDNSPIAGAFVIGNDLPESATARFEYSTLMPFGTGRKPP